MGFVLAAGQRIPLDAYEADPTSFSDVLRAARTRPGFALCACREPAPQLVIRTLPHPAGATRYVLATWPNGGTAHAPQCRFAYSLEEWQAARAARAAAIERAADGTVQIHLRFSLQRRNTGEQERIASPATSPAVSDARPDPSTSESAARPAHDTLDLDGLLLWLWQEAGLLAPAVAGSVRRWSDVLEALTPIISRAQLGKSSLSTTLYAVPVYVAEAKGELRERYEIWLNAHARTEKFTPRALILGEVRDTQDKGRFVLTFLKHHGPALFMRTRLAREIARKYPSAEDALAARGQGVSDAPRVVGLFLAEVTDQQNLWISDAVLLPVNSGYVPEHIART